MSAVPEETPPPTLQTPEAFELVASDGGPLRLDFYAPSGDAAGGRGAILCHGFRGYKDWGFLSFLATRLAEEGLPVAAFNFASSGITDREGTFGEPERFRAGTYAGDLTDLARVADWMEARVGAGGSARLGLAGHSRGGVIAVLHAARDRRVRAVATLGAPARIGVWPEATWEAWRRGDAAEVYDFRTRQALRLGPDLLHDWETNAARYDTAATLSALAAPVLVVHGTRDALVPLAEAEERAQDRQREQQRWDGWFEAHQRAPQGTGTLGDHEHPDARQPPPQGAGPAVAHRLEAPPSSFSSWRSIARTRFSSSGRR